MNFKIINEHLIENRKETDRLKEVIKKRITEIKHLDSNELQNVNAELYFEKTKKEGYQLSAIVKAENDLFFLQEKHLNPADCVSLLFNEIELKLQKKFTRRTKIN